MTAGQSDKLERLLDTAGKDPDILAVILYGSAARGEQGPRSDIDVCLVLAPDRIDADRAQMARKRLEYLNEFAFDIQVFQELPVFVRRRVLKEGRVLLAKDEQRLYQIAYRTAQAFGDFKHLYDEYLSQVSRGRS